MKTKCLLLAAVFGGLFAAPLLGQPTFVTQPTNQTVSVGANVQFRVTVAPGTPNLQFQWWFKDAALEAVLNPSATGNILRLTNVTAAMVGDYWAVATGDNGSTSSDKGRLTVDPTFVKLTKGAIVADREASVTGTWCDYDNDGFPDLFVGNSIYPNSSTCSLYHNNKDGTFERVTNSITTRLDVAVGSAWADCDNDGTADLYVVHYATNRVNTLYRGIGAGDFTPGTAVPLQAQSGALDAAWGDIDNDGWLDLFVNTGVSGANDSLLRNAGAGQLVALTSDQAGAVVTNHVWTVSAAWCDFDNDGDADLFVSNHEGPSFLYRNDGTGHFENIGPTLLPTVGSATCGTWADMNNDGFFDLLVTTGQANNLYLNQNGQSFSDVTEAAGVALTGLVWGPAWGDYDNDGDVDLFVPDYDKTNAFFANKGDGTFIQVDVGSPLRDGFRDECASWADYDQDGFLDLFIPCGEGSPSPNLLYHNNLPATGNRNHWLAVQLRGQVANRMGIGAKVRVRAQISGREVWQVRQIASNGAIASGAELIAHFGLGDATKADLIRIEWPSGNVQELADYDANSLYTFTEPVRIQPVRPSASPGGAVVLTASVGASYQWRFNGVDLAGETRRTLSLTNITAAMAGRYSVAVPAADGTPATHFTYLNVDPTFTKINQGPVVEGTESGWTCSWADYDDDDDLDLLVCNAGDSTSREYLGFFRNDGAAGFVRLTDEASSLPGAPGYYSNGTWADFNNDGALDCAVGEWDSENSALALHRGLGSGRFERVVAASLLSPRAGYLTWVDYDNDGWLDLFSGCAYTVGAEIGGDRTPTNQLFRGTRDGEFVAVTQGSLAVDRYLGVEGASWGDYDGDGDLDVLVIDTQAWLVNRAYPNCLYRNDGAGVFTRIADGPIARDQAFSVIPAWADYDNDGRLDLFVSCYNDTSRLFHNEGDGVFTKRLMGPGRETAYPAWGDFDNDGDLDLYVSRGQNTATTNLFYLNNGDGSFTSVTTGSPAQDVARSASCLWGDYDGDGFLDLLVVNNKGGSDCLYHNNGNANGWLVVRLKGTVSNRSAIGAKVRVQARIGGKTFWQMREVPGGNRCQGDLRQHFGLGDAAKALNVRIEWPSGIVQELKNVPAKQILTVTEPTELVALGEGRIWVRCWKGMKYEVEVSNDLTAWNSLGVFTNETGRLEVTDAGAAGQPYRFYRAIER